MNTTILMVLMMLLASACATSSANTTLSNLRENPIHVHTTSYPGMLCFTVFMNSVWFVSAILSCQWTEV